MCVCVALDIHHAMRMRRIVICDPSGSTLFFSLYFIKGTISGTNVTEYKKRVSIYSPCSGSLSPRHGASSGCGYRNGLR